MTVEDRLAKLVEQVTAMQARISDLEMQNALHNMQMHTFKGVVVGALSQAINTISQNMPDGDLHIATNISESHNCGSNWNGMNTPLTGAQPPVIHNSPQLRADSGGSVSPELGVAEYSPCPGEGNTINTSNTGRHRRDSDGGQSVDSFGLFPNNNVCEEFNIPVSPVHNEDTRPLHGNHHNSDFDDTSRKRRRSRSPSHNHCLSYRRDHGRSSSYSHGHSRNNFKSRQGNSTTPRYQGYSRNQVPADHKQQKQIGIRERVGSKSGNANRELRLQQFAERDNNSTKKQLSARPQSYVSRGGWRVIDSTQDDDDNTPAMPVSVAHISGTKVFHSSYDKVVAWREDTSSQQPVQMGCRTSIGISSGSEQDTRSKSSSSINQRLGANSSSAGNYIWGDKGDNDNDDNDNDDEDLSWDQLCSKGFRSSKASTELKDSSGTLLAADRLAKVWSVCAWVPLDDLPEYYQQCFKVHLWTDESRRLIRMGLKNLPGISERMSSNDNVQCTLLFRDNCHLKLLTAFNRLFVKSPVPEPILFFYLVTSVLRPLSFSQANIIAKLWVDEFQRSPVGLTTVKRSNGFGQIKWHTVDSLWKIAIEWLCELARGVSTHGKDYIVSKLTNWGHEDRSMYSHNSGSLASGDPDCDMVYGLTQDELIQLLRITPILLSRVMTSKEIDALGDEL